MSVFRFCLNGCEKSKLEDKKFLDKPVLFVHGFLGSIFSWFYNEQSIPLQFIDKGYDVWIVNLRGNLFSWSHRDPKISPKEFFDYNFHIHGEVDIPTVYENILKITKEDKITLVGNSLGGLFSIHTLTNETTTDYINKHTERVLLVAPAIFLGYAEDPYIAKKLYTTEEIDDILVKANEMKIYHFGTGCFNTDAKEYQKVIKYAEKKYGGYDFTKSSLFILDGVQDNFMNQVAYPELHKFIFPF